MSGLLAKYLMLLMAAAMTGVTAFTVSPVPSAAARNVGSPEAVVGRALAVGPVGPFIASRIARPNHRLTDLGLLADVSAGPMPSKKSATLVFGGDILIHNGVRNVSSLGGGEFDFRPLFEGIRPVVASADLAICHLEVPLSADDTSYSSYPRFNAPAEVADAIAHAGFDGCSTASNHSIDEGIAGLTETLEILDSAGVGHAGTARNPAEARNATIYELPDLRVAHVAATWWLNGLSAPEGDEWMIQDLEPASLIDMARRARLGGADLVVASVHCCTEYRRDPTSQQVEWFRQLIESPYIDLVVGHHSHVVGPIEEFDGEFIVYGMGNLLSGQLHRSDAREGVLVVAEARWSDAQWKFAEVSVVPTWVEARYNVIPASPDGGIFGRTMEAVRALGADVTHYGLAGSADDG